MQRAEIQCVAFLCFENMLKNIFRAYAYVKIKE